MFDLEFPRQILLSWFETSAKDNLNIDEACRFLVTRILENDRLLAAKMPQGVKPRAGIVRPGDVPPASPAPSNGCCA